jgi:hypothetical protein
VGCRIRGGARAALLLRLATVAFAPARRQRHG